MQRRSVTFSECGPVRELNADFVLADDALGFYAVADGVGSLPESAQASRTVVSQAHRLYRARGQAELDLTQFIGELYSAYRIAFPEPALVPTTTFTVLLVAGRKVRYVNIGDSPLFLIQGEEVTLMTREHCLVDQDVYYADFSEMKEQPGSNRIVNAFDVDAPHVIAYPSLELDAPTRLIMCTDGLMEFVSQDGLGVLSGLAETPGDMLAALRLAAAAGVPDDNYSGIVIDLSD